MFLRRVFLILLASTFCTLPIAAQQGNVWAFGYHGGLDFNYSPPKLINTSIANQVGNGAVAGASSISDCNGQLLFYGSSSEIFNRFHRRMPHGTLNMDGSGAAPIYIIPKPGDSGKYFYFYPRWGNIGADTGIDYAIVDMSLDSGRGDVVSVSKLQKYRTASFVVIRHSNGVDYWLASLIPRDTFLVYPITSTGIDIPDKYNLFPGIYHQGPHLRANHKGDKIVYTWAVESGKFRSVLFDFNSKNGKVLYTYKSFFDGTVGNGLGTIHSEFSPNDSFLYISSWQNWDPTPPRKSWIWQFETYVKNIEKTGVKILEKNWGTGSPPYNESYFMQMGPDNKIYIGIPGDSTLSIINQPDKKGLACQFTYRSLSIAPNVIGLVMPTLLFPYRKLKMEITEGCIDTVSFKNLSDTPYFKSFIWYFGDGDSSTKYSPKHAYRYSGKYLVKLLGLNTCGAKQWYEDTIEVHVPARPGFAQDTVIYTCGKANVYLKALTNDPTNTFVYDFGDSTALSKDKNPVHTYAKSGKYRVKQVAFNGSCKDSLYDSVSVAIEPFPKAGFKSNNQDGCTPFTFTISNESKDAYSFRWLFDDGTSDTAANPTHTLKDTGWHSATLLAFNHQGCVDTLTKPKMIYVSPPPVPKFSYTTKKVCGGIEVHFKNESQYADKFEWDFDDGNKSKSKDPDHIFTAGRVFQVRLKAANQYCDSTITFPLSIILPDQAKPGFIADRYIGCPNLLVSFKDTSINTTRQVWDFGDGSKDSVKNPQHVFVKPRSYIVTLTTYNPEGCPFTFKKEIKVLPYPISKFSTDKGMSGCQQLEYTCHQESLYADSFRWDFGDGSPILVSYDTTTSPIKHAYLTEGKYKVILTAMNGFCSDTSSIIKTVPKLRPRPIPSFNIPGYKYCENYAFVQFTNLSTNADSFLWDFGDSTLSRAREPLHVYKKVGAFKVTLWSFSKEGCQVVVKDTLQIQILPTPTSAITPLPKTRICGPSSITFNTTDFDSTCTYLWNFDNGDSSFVQNPTTRFDLSKREYHVKLIVSNGFCKKVSDTIITMLNLKEDRDTASLACVTVVDNKHIRITWNSLPLAEGYILSRSEDGISFTRHDTFYRRIDTTFLDTKVDVANKSYFYKVIARDACQGQCAASKIGRSILLQGQKTGEDESAQLTWNSYQIINKPTSHDLLRNGTSIASFGNGGTYTDIEYFDVHELQRCYVVRAESVGTNLPSYSNEVCISYDPRIFIPNIFTPNRDSINDEFEIITTGIQWLEFSVYNRWGQKVYEQSDKTKHWIPENIVDGAYVYILRAKTSGGQWIYRKGNITLMR